MDFPTIESLQTLDQAKTAYAQLLDAVQALQAEKAQASEDLAAIATQLAAAKADHASALEAEQERCQALKEDLACATALLDEAGKEKAALLSKTERAQSKALETEQKLTESIAQLQSAQAQVAQLQADAKSAELQAAQMCASVGVDPVQITPSGDTQQTTLLEQMRAIENPAEQMAFFRKHKEAILRGN